MVWDVYRDDSSKSTTRDRRGFGVRREVNGKNNLPQNWNNFLKNSQNKTDLFKFLALEMMQIQCGKEIVSTYGETVLTNLETVATDDISPTNHEEADTRLFLHAMSCSRAGYKRISIRTVDTDVVVLAITLFDKLSLDELWIAFGCGRNFRHIPVHEIGRSLGEKKHGLTTFHALTGCDQTSFFAGQGKKKAFETWVNYEEVTPAFVELSQSPEQESVEKHLPVIEQFVVLMYDKSTKCRNVNAARRELFTKRGRTIDAIPPTHAALKQHVKRAVFQAGHVWGNSLKKIQELPCRSNWGWTKSSGSWKPFWTTLPDVSKSCQQLIKCKCNGSCKGSCKCKQRNLKCTALCRCDGQC